MNSTPDIGMRGVSARAGFFGAFFAVFLFYLALPLVCAALFRAKLLPASAALVLIPAQPLLALAAALTFRRRGGNTEPLFRPARIPFRHLLWAFPAILLLIGVTGVTWQTLLDAAGVSYGTPPTEQLIRSAAGPLLVEFFITAVFLAPVAEEVLFRALLYDGLKPFSGAVFAASASAILFAVLHDSLLQLAPLFCLALALQYARNRGGLPFAILLHALNNLAAFTCLFAVSRW